jgi:hypothetical protein
MDNARYLVRGEHNFMELSPKPLMDDTRLLRRLNHRSNGFKGLPAARKFEWAIQKLKDIRRICKLNRWCIFGKLIHAYNRYYPIYSQQTAPRTTPSQEISFLDWIEEMHKESNSDPLVIREMLIHFRNMARYLPTDPRWVSRQDYYARRRKVQADAIFRYRLWDACSNNGEGMSHLEFTEEIHKESKGNFDVKLEMLSHLSTMRWRDLQDSKWESRQSYYTRRREEHTAATVRRLILWRNSVQTRRIVLFWMEETAVKTCAVGGVNRIRDQIAFEADFSAMLY